MKLAFSKQAFEQLDAESRRNLQRIACDCVCNREAEWNCDSCGGYGVVYEMELSAEDSASIQENLRSQGVPLGKIGTS